MRKIEEQMCDALASGKNWQSGNTQVADGKVFLHGNHIATLTSQHLWLFDGGWQTVTTKSRLNALCDRFTWCPTDGVFAKNFTWFVRSRGEVLPFDIGGPIPRWSIEMPL